MFRIARFLLLFNLFALPLYIILLTGYTNYVLQNITTTLVHFLLQITGITAVHDGVMISIPIENGQWSGVISWDCVGWKSILALFALIFATDFPMRKKVKGFLLLAPVIYIVNILRIWFIFFYISTNGLAYYSLIHTVIWSWGLISILLVTWIIWMRRMKPVASIIRT